MRIIIAILVCVLAPLTAHAQFTPRPALRNETIVAIGWAGSEYGLRDYNRWRGSLFVAAGGGHYWTNHLKTEVEGAWSSRSNSETYEDLVVDGHQTYAVSTHRIREVRLSIGQGYQFGHNAWVHPLVGAGADVMRRESLLDRPAQSRVTYGGARPATTVVIPAVRESGTRVLVRPYVKTGLKMYASESTFFATELKFGFGTELERVLWKIGLGVDF